jgi:hypothetical protein
MLMKLTFSHSQIDLRSFGTLCLAVDHYPMKLFQKYAGFLDNAREDYARALRAAIERVQEQRERGGRREGRG